MKRTVIGVILIAVAVTVAVTGFADLSKTGKQLVLFLSKAENAFEAGNCEKGLDDISHAVEIWKNVEKRYKIYLNHEELDELELCFDLLEVKIKESTKAYESPDAFYDDLKELLNESVSRINHILNSQKPKISEVF